MIIFISDMSNSSTCINDLLPLEILQKIFFLSAESFKDALSISTTCRLWRKLIYDTFIIERYWTFDNEHRKRNLVYWWDFDRNVNGQNNPFADFPTKDCFLGKCASLTYENENSTQINIDESKYTIDRGSDYTLALWLLVTETGNYYFYYKNLIKDKITIFLSEKTFIFHNFR